MNTGFMRSWMGDRVDGPAPTTITQVAAPVAAPATTDTNTNTNNDSVNDDKLIDSVFKQVVGDPPPANQQPANNQQQQQQQVDPQQVLQDQFKRVGIENFTLTDEEKQALQQTGNFDPIANRMTSMMQNVYVNAMRDMNTLMNSKLEQSKKDANNYTEAYLTGVNLKNYLETEIPYIKDDALLGPVAETMFGKFYELTKKDRNKAVELTKKALSRTADTVNKNNPDFNLNGGSFRGAPQDKQGDQDWLGALRGQR